MARWNLGRPDFQLAQDIGADLIESLRLYSKFIKDTWKTNAYLARAGLASRRLRLRSSQTGLDPQSLFDETWIKANMARCHVGGRSGSGCAPWLRAAIAAP
ncbi:hypothetical protein FJ959_11110 [Mesorhizobium sp. B2-2-4]|nr:hypothetical protein FJ959_11110 [Mesorhizobium sp. B2-2-4]TPM65806.1 hypothetical protein FJ965_16725 [Mesorhizobium sp. B2-2-1]TPN30493.1 hypothetical protein FJ979_30700 [Mesorhizobium sp. B1-1-6]TPN72132.1 hypothetical protein FJ984_04705 [Mesorhizobium sp. B1-1-3]